MVYELGVGDKQRVEILKVLYRGAGILILDEPTAVLVPHEVNELFGSLRNLTQHGSTVVFISHKLDEVLEHADAITVIRAGRTVGEVPDPSTVTSRQLAEMMVGSELPSPETRESTVQQKVLLEVVGLTIESGALAPLEGPAAAFSVSEVALETDEAPPERDVVSHRPLDDVSFAVHAGEIVGVAGVEGNGQTELVEAIMGLRSATGDRAPRGSATRQREHARAAPARPRLYPGGPPARWHGPVVPAVGERAARAPSWAAVRQRRLRRPQAGPSAHERHRRGVRRAHPRDRGRRVHVVRRQPAEADRRPRDDERPAGAHRLPPDARRRRRRAGRDLGHPARRPGEGARHAAHLRRPRGADRPVRPLARHAARARRRRTGSGAGHSGRPRVVHDWRRDRRATPSGGAP